MIALNRSDRRPLHDQLAEQIRFLAATGHYRPGDLLPSTRRLAGQLGVSFHTVRRAYGSLATAGVLHCVPGTGFRVAQPEERPKGERLEAGASVVQQAIRGLVSLGVTDEEMAYLFEEQLELARPTEPQARIAYVAEYTEASTRVAEQLTARLGLDVDGIAVGACGSVTGIDYAVAPFPLVRQVMERMPGADVFGIQVDYSAEAAAAVSRLYDHQTVLLAVRYSDAVAPIGRSLRASTGFGGQIIATVVDEPDARLGTLVRQSDVLLYTAAAARRLRPHLASAAIHCLLDPVLPDSEVDRIRSLLPG